MYLAKMHLRNFRTYHSCTVDLQPGLNVFYGENAAGKTNFLEAVTVMATGRSPRAARDQEMAAWGQDSFFLKGLIERKPAPVAVELAWVQQKGKAFRVNGHVQQGLAAMAGILPHVYISPEELAVINGAPVRRRNFLDQLLGQISSPYVHHMEQYRQALEQRNALLREIRSGNASKDLLAIWDEPLAASGGEIIARRQAAVRELGRIVREEYQRFWPDAELDVCYRPALDGAGNKAAGAVSGAATLTARVAGELLRKALERERDQEVARGFTTVGPHRDELALYIDRAEARLFASQGQRRSLLLALKLAAAQLLEQWTGFKPLLLLDDILSELDRTRRARLLGAALSGNQVFLTCTELDAVKEIEHGGGTSYRVEKGDVAHGGPIPR